MRWYHRILRRPRFKIWFYLLVVEVEVVLVVLLVDEVEPELIYLSVAHKCFEIFFLTCWCWTRRRCSAYEKTCILSEYYQYSSEPNAFQSKIWYPDLNGAGGVKYPFIILFNIFVTENAIRMRIQMTSSNFMSTDFQIIILLTCRRSSTSTGRAARSRSRT